ncbi:MAG: glycosyltransferase [Bacteroidetes bacterium]|nr:glycosyltransferase [Bacteroidota bacterium]
MAELKKRILLIGPLPPPLGGTRVSFDLLLKDIEKSNLDFSLISLRVLPGRFANMLLQIKLFFQILLSIPFYQIISFHANPQRVGPWGIVFFAMARIFKRKFQIRLFGSDLDLYCEAKPLHKWYYKRLGSSDRILLQTKGLITFWKENIGSVENIEWFPTSRPANKLVRKEEKLPSDKTTFVYVGHVKKEKGIQVLVEACMILSKQEADFIVKVIGKCTDDTILRQLEQTPTIQYLGELPHAEIGKQLLQADAFVYPSFWKGEGYPGALIEAMEAGLPIVTTRWRFLDELVEEGRNGFLVPIENNKGLADVMRKLVNNQAMLKEMGEQSYERSKEFNSTDWNRKFIEIVGNN